MSLLARLAAALPFPDRDAKVVDALAAALEGRDLLNPGPGDAAALEQMGRWWASALFPERRPGFVAWVEQTSRCGVAAARRHRLPDDATDPIVHGSLAGGGEDGLAKLALPDVLPAMAVFELAHVAAATDSIDDAEAATGWAPPRAPAGPPGARACMRAAAGPQEAAPPAPARAPLTFAVLPLCPTRRPAREDVAKAIAERLRFSPAFRTAATHPGVIRKLLSGAASAEAAAAAAAAAGRPPPLPWSMVAFLLATVLEQAEGCKCEEPLAGAVAACPPAVACLVRAAGLRQAEEGAHPEQRAPSFCRARRPSACTPSPPTSLRQCGGRRTARRR
jgi:hypothetical protein